MTFDVTPISIVLIAVVGAVGAILAFKVNVKFDLNRWLEQRRERQIERLRSLCPHTVLESMGKKIQIRSYFNSPPGTHQWICGKCGLVTEDDARGEELVKVWGEDPSAWAKRMKKFNKLYKKVYKV